MLVQIVISSFSSLTKKRQCCSMRDALKHTHKTITTAGSRGLARWHHLLTIFDVLFSPLFPQTYSFCCSLTNRWVPRVVMPQRGDTRRCSNRRRISTSLSRRHVLLCIKIVAPETSMRLQFIGGCVVSLLDFFWQSRL